MGRIKVVHTADLHLGARLPGPAAQYWQAAPQGLYADPGQDFGNMQGRANRFAPHCRRLVGRAIRHPALVDFVADRFRRIPETKVVIAPGNSDFNHLNSFYREYPWPDNVHIFTNRTCPASGFPISMPGYTVAHGGRSAAGWTGSSLRTARAPRS